MSIKKNQKTFPATKSWLPLSLSVMTITILFPSVAGAYGSQFVGLSVSGMRGAPVVGAPVPRVVAASFITNQLLPAAADKSLLLWSVYPASIRGRAFGGTGGMPTLTTIQRFSPVVSSGFSGGGW